MGLLQPFFTTYPWSEPFSAIIDVRSPSEFAEDHVPGAVNLPVLNDLERAEVGTLYKQVSPFTARKRGAALVSANIANHLSTYLLDQPKDFHPLIYCWRGGQRSMSMATVLSHIGWRAGILQGGYKAYRAYVRQELERVPPSFQFNVLCGLTGTAKTKILRQMENRGLQVLDLEKLAHHRGSLLGYESDWAQPSQKGFDSVLLVCLKQLDARAPVWVEAESNKIGQVFIPPRLWSQLKQGRCVEITASKEARVQYLIEAYPHFVNQLSAVGEQLQHLKQRYGKAQIAAWQQLIDQDQVDKLVRSLLDIHYDPAYRRSMQQQYVNQIHQIPLLDLREPNIENAVQQLHDLTVEVGHSAP